MATEAECGRRVRAGARRQGFQRRTYICIKDSQGSGPEVMASRILHRLRRTISKQEKDEEKAETGVLDADVLEECPESRDLVDDTDGLSMRLSGTLSFNSDREDDDDDEGLDSQSLEVSCDLELPQDSEASKETVEQSTSGECGQASMLTKQLQESWRKSQIRTMPQRLAFDVTDASVVRDKASRYVVYTIYLIKSGTFDQCPAIIYRRYSDFEKLNRRLRRLFHEDMHDIVFPRKRMRKNFAAETIAKRSRAFESFLSQVSAIPDICRCREFLEFFYLRDLQAAQRLTRTGLYREALAVWTNAWHLQDKLGASSASAHVLLNLAGLTVCHQEVDQLPEAQGFCQEAVQRLESQDRHPLLPAFLRAHIHLSWKVGKDKRQSEAKLQKLTDTELDNQKGPSLKEILIKEALS
ncbi:sorting nexin-21 isoform X1 [Pleurodeles waltl]|uniref:sorting nexin-21 isoform X1 n=1 Tax=Pleurodeles waltl TaxID=8319 RepID=UPI0037098C1B